MTGQVTNEDIMQALNEFANNIDGRFDGVDERLDKVESRLDKVEYKLDEHTRILDEHTRILDEHTRILDEHTHILNEHSAQFGSINSTLELILGEQESHKNDIIAIYEILGRIESKQAVTQAELDLTKAKLERIVGWAKHVAKKLDIPLKI